MELLTFVTVVQRHIISTTMLILVMINKTYPILHNIKVPLFTPSLRYTKDRVRRDKSYSASPLFTLSLRFRLDFEKFGMKKKFRENNFFLGVWFRENRKRKIWGKIRWKNC